MFAGQKGIGLYEIFDKIKMEDEGQVKPCVNFDVKTISPGHLDYSYYSKDFLYLVKDSYWVLKY